MATAAQNFKKAHKLAKKVHRAGDCYRITFGAALKLVLADEKKKAQPAAVRYVMKRRSGAWSTTEKLAFVKANGEMVDAVFATSLFHADYAKSAKEAREYLSRNKFQCKFVALATTEQVAAYRDSKRGQ